MCSRKWLIVALVVCGLASACSQFNTNLTVQTSSSTLSTLAPSSLTAGATGFTLTATGSGFVSGAVLLWNANSSSPISLTTTFVNGTTLTAPVPASYLATPGTIAVAVDIPGSATSGTSSISATTTTEVSNLVFFTVTAQPAANPSIGSISPSSMPFCSNTSGFPLTVKATSGTTFTSDSVVNWNGSPRATTFSATQLTATILPMDTAVSGPVTVSVNNSAGTSNSQSFTLTSRGPDLTGAKSISSLSPSSILAGSASFSLTVNGSNFLPCSVVRWGNGTTLASMYVSPTQLTATVPAGLIQTVGNFQVFVFTPVSDGTANNPTSQTSGPSTFSTTQPSAPTITSLVSSNTTDPMGMPPTPPTTPFCNQASSTLTVQGTNFLSFSVINWNGAPLPTFYVQPAGSPAYLTAVIPTSDTAVAGTASITVSNGPVSSNSLPLSVAPSSTALAAPVAASLLPASATAGTGPFNLNVNGSNFLPCSVVQWNGTPRATNYASSTLLNVAITAADIATIGTAQVTVMTPAPGGGSSTLPFQIAGPMISSLSASTTQLPSTPYCNSGPTVLTVNGSNFTSDAVVNWNGAPLLPTTFVNSTQLTATLTPAQTAFQGTATVTVTSAVATTNSAIFTMTVPTTPLPMPSVSSLSPKSANAGVPGFLLTVNDDNTSNMLPCSVVQWNGSNRTTVFIGTTGLNASISAADVANPGTFPVTVFTPAPGGGTSTVTANSTFTVFGPPFPAVRSASADAMAASNDSSASGSSDSLALPVMSADHRYTVVVMASTDGVTEIPGTQENIFVRDTCAGVTTGCTPSVTIASIGFNSNPADGKSISPSISSDGRYVTFISDAKNLVASDTNAVADVFVRDTCAGAGSACSPSTRRVSVATDGTQANGESTSATISADGRYVTFISSATNLDSNTSAVSGIFLRDTCAGVVSCTPSTQRLQ